MSVKSASDQGANVAGDTAGERFDPLSYMIRALEYGLDFSIKDAGRDEASDTVVYQSPHNWTHGQIRAWIKALKVATENTREHDRQLVSWALKEAMDELDKPIHDGEPIRETLMQINIDAIIDEMNRHNCADFSPAVTSDPAKEEGRG